MSKYHKTAMSRKNFSTPVQYLLKNGYLEHPKHSLQILDYGCGRGYDVEHLCDDELLEVEGYDPNGEYSESGALDFEYDVIMSNFVLNVIEDWDERLAVENDIIDHLKEGGTAYIAVRNDRNVANGCTSTGTWQGYVKPIHENWVLIEENSKFKMWKFTK